MCVILMLSCSENVFLEPKHCTQNLLFSFKGNISRVSDQNGVSLLCIMLEIHHSGPEPSI